MRHGDVYFEALPFQLSEDDIQVICGQGHWLLKDQQW
jgi:hypothetical protein